MRTDARARGEPSQRLELSRARRRKTNVNGLAELVRDVRSTQGLYVPDEFRCYTLNFADPIFERIFREEKGFDIVANFSAHKHVRSEKDRYSVQALIENGSTSWFDKLVRQAHHKSINP